MKYFIYGFTCLMVIAACKGQAQKNAGQIPSQAQLRWHDDEYYLFIHFGPNTFTDLEWGKGTEQAEVFNPDKLDTRQWCRIAKLAGAVGIIITAKHHDGFCLWPSNFSTHTVRESKWRDGTGDVLKELSAACKEYSLKFGVYLSPWDRNHPKYGTPEYNEVYVNMMKEIFENYGPIWEFWWDGANGEGPNGKRQEYDWDLFRKTIRSLSPSTVVFSDVGPDIRWVGNESGFAGETNWNLLNVTGFTPGEGAPKQDVLNSGNENGEKWIPAECDVSIRPGWFYHKEEDSKVKSPEQLFELYLKSVGRGANLLLNVPPDRHGLFTAFDSASLIGFKDLRDRRFKENVLAKGGCKIEGRKCQELIDQKNTSFVKLKAVKESAEITLAKPTSINCLVISEALQFGQQVKKFKVQLLNEKGTIARELEGTTIGHKRILTFPFTQAARIRIQITDAKANVVLSEVSAYGAEGIELDK